MAERCCLGALVAVLGDRAVTWGRRTSCSCSGLTALQCCHLHRDVWLPGDVSSCPQASRGSTEQAQCAASSKDCPGLFRPIRTERVLVMTQLIRGPKCRLYC